LLGIEKKKKKRKRSHNLLFWCLGFLETTIPSILFLGPLDFCVLILDIPKRGFCFSNRLFEGVCFCNAICCNHFYSLL
jgi:hypothetical protein